jgi:hypothetical protein
LFSPSGSAASVGGFIDPSKVLARGCTRGESGSIAASQDINFVVVNYSSKMAPSSPARVSKTGGGAIEVYPAPILAVITAGPNVIEVIAAIATDSPAEYY